jgi:hypothetical protein
VCVFLVYNYNLNIRQLHYVYPNYYNPPSPPAAAGPPWGVGCFLVRQRLGGASGQDSMNRRDNRTRGPLLANGMAGHFRPTATIRNTKKHLRAAECHQRQRVHLVYHASHIQRVISFLVFSFWHKYQLQIYVFFFYQQNFFQKKRK